MTTMNQNPNEPLAIDPPLYEYSWDFDQGLGPWTTWFAPSVVNEVGGEHENFTRLNAPGILDPNHIDGIGALRLIAHLAVPLPGSPGILNLTDGEFEITIRATDFNINGGQLVVWLTRRIPEENVTRSFYAPLTATNWANTGNDLASQLVEGEWVTLTVRLSDNLADWTYAGENQTQQGDWADRYQYIDLPGTLANMDSTFHLVTIHNEPDEFPTGFLDLANITIRTHEPATPVDPGAATRELFYGLEDQATTGTLAGDDAVPLGTFSVVAGSVRNGSVSVDPVTGAFVFTPNADYYGPTDFVGPASFRYVVSDGVTSSVQRTAYFFIGGTNDAPVASVHDEATEVAAGEAFVSTVRIGTDVDTDERLTYEIVLGSATNGTVTINPENGRYTFTPTSGFSGTATFSYLVTDGQAGSAPKTVTLTVLPPGQQPDRLTYNEAVDVLIAGDFQGFVSAVILLADTGSVGAAYFYGTWLRYGLNVPKDTELAAHYLSQATSVPEGLLVLADMYATGEGVDKDYAYARELYERLPTNAEALYRVAILYDNGFGGPLDEALAVETYLLAAKLGHAEAMYTVGRRYLMGEGVAVSPADAYFWIGAGLKYDGGPALAVFDELLTHNQDQAIDLGLTAEQVADLDGAIAAWSVGQPSPVNDAPVAGDAPDAITAPAGSVINGTLAPGTDVDGDRLSFLLIDGSVQNGSVTIDAATGAYVFTPNPGYFGPAEFRYVVSDGQDVSDEILVSLVLEKVTAAFADVSGVAETQTLSVSAASGLLSNDLVSDPGVSISVGSVAGQAGNVGQPVAGVYGSVTINADGSYVFVANAASAALIQGQSANESFDYTIIDELGVASSATLVVTVTGVGGTVLSGDGTLIGSAFGDVITGGTGSNVIVGGGGDDVVAGGAGANEVYGGLGNDTFLVSQTGDTLVEFENEGTDTVQTALNAYALRLHIENLTFTGTGAFTGSGTDQNNVITGGASDDVLTGLGGNDILIGGLGADVLDGGIGVDVVSYAASSAAVTIGLRGQAGSGGDAAGDALTGIETLIGSNFDDVLSGGVGNNRLEGGLGIDTVDYSNASARVNAQLNSNAASNDGDGGVDTFSSIENLTGSMFNDVLIGDANANVLRGGAGADTLVGLAGNDTLWGGSGALNTLQGGLGDDLYVLEAADTIVEFTGEGTDTVDARINTYVLANNVENLLFGGSGNFAGTGNGLDNVITGGASADILAGMAGADTLFGDAGDDTLRGGAGNDALIGGLGIDLADYAAAAGGVTVNLLTGNATNDGDGGADTLTSIENLTGSAFNDSLTGDANANVLRGGAGADTLNGGDGDDVLNGGAGVDVLTGGAGIDTADYSLAAAGMRAQLNSNVSTNDGDGGTDTFSGIENLTGSAFNDILIGDANANVLRGGTGADTLIGLAGNDTLWGGSGALNTLQGGLGDDLYVLEAADTIVEFTGEGTDTVDARINTYVLASNVERLVFGGTGNFAGTGNALANVITGGTGNDTLRGRGGVDVLNGGLGVDTADYTLAAAGVVARIDLQRATNDGDGATDTYSGIENLIGSNFNDTLIGDNNANVLMGGIGQDILLGFGGNDILMGGSAGSNQLQGGTGDDWYIIDAFDTCVEFANEGTDTVEARVGSYTLGANIENLIYTGPGKFVGNGNALDNVLTGGALDDILRGKGGNDTIRGGSGTDEVQFVGTKAQYTVTAEGAGWRIVDTVASRDGSTYVESIERLRFLTGNTTTTLTYGAPGALEPTDKAVGEDFGGPVVLPGPEDDFVLAGKGDGPEVLPSVFDESLPQRLSQFGQFDLWLRQIEGNGHPLVVDGPGGLQIRAEGNPDIDALPRFDPWH